MRKFLLFIPLLLFCLSSVFSQNKTIKGKVTDQTKATPLQGVSVTVRGNPGGVQTDADGNFSISVPSSARTLLFSYIGFADEEVAIGNKSVVDIGLTTEDKKLQEVVVVGYGTQRKKDITAAVSVIAGEKIKNAPVQSFDQALAGKAAGLNVTLPNGVLNNPPVIRVRGASSITGSSYPLIVVDGVPIFTGDVSTNNAPNNPLGDINPADIEDITVLKDAAATAIYGSRAAPGVLVITTKKGKAGSAKVNYDGWFGITKPFKLWDVLNAEQYISVKNQARANVGLAPAYFMDTINGAPVDTRWYDYIFRTGYAQNHSVNVSGANTSGGRYYMSVGYTRQDGMFINNDFNRMQARLNVEQKAKNWLTVSAGINYSKSVSESPNTGSISQGAFNTSGAARLGIVNSPVASAYKADGSYNILLPIEQNQIGRNKSVERTGFTNPALLNDLNKITSGNDHIQGNVALEFKLLKGLTFKTLYGIDYLIVENKSFYNSIHGDGLQATGTQDDGSAFNDVGKYNQRVWQNYLNYNRTFGARHTLGVTAGTEQQYSTVNRWAARRSGVTDPFYTSIQGGFNTWDNPPLTSANTLPNLITENYLLSYLGRVSYDFDKRYFLSASFRRDGYSAYSPGDIDGKWGNFPGVSVGWQVSNEGFWKNSGLEKTISDLKLRGSYGKVGNTNISDFGALSTYSSGLYGTYPTLFYNQAGNNALKWEDNFKLDIGFTFGLWQDRITGELNYFNNKYKDLIIYVPTPPSQGIPNNSILQNTAEMVNKGFEFSLNAAVIDKKDLRLNIGFNIATLNNNVTKLANGVTEVVGLTGSQNGANERANITRVGSSIASIYTVTAIGVNPDNGQRMFLDAQGRRVQFDFARPAGSQYTYVDGGGVAPNIDLALDGRIQGPSLPKYFGGLQINLNYKDFDLGLDIIYSGGNYIYNGTKAGLRDQRFWNNDITVLDSWKKPGDITDVPKLIWNDNISNGSGIQISTNVEKGDYVKGRAVTLGYTLNRKVTSAIGITGIRFYGQVQNFFVITNYSGADPEVATNGNNAIGTGSISPGIDRNTAPQARTITFGLNVNF